jgi:hypothetical protein
MRYKVRVEYNQKSQYIQRWWLVKRSSVLGFIMHSEEGPAYEVIAYLNTPYTRNNKSYYLRGNKCRNRSTWLNGLEYKCYKGKGLI